ncbi:MAG: GNAT family N-acetyltransferase [Xanthomonadales bacterium]|nr:GNAT family N-acetyltransferase [Xanthomonadales bacterium]NIX12642.1 GNAT family N-acetyltransferase [Xanthomonadales bacterium]
MPQKPGRPLELTVSTPEHLETLKTWFPDRDSLWQWGSPHFRHPFTDESFLEDAFWGKMPTYSALDEEGSLAAFGQYYERAGRCHLARLVVDPVRRSAGLGRWFTAALLEIGLRDLGAAEASLFVYRDNAPAVCCYRSLGFREHEWPPDREPWPEVMFMVRLAP